MDTAKLQAELRKARRQLQLLYEIGNLMRLTIQLDELVFLILSAVTSHEGLGFNRAAVFLIDDSGDALSGFMGIGPKSPEEADRIWRHIDEHHLQLEGFLDIYHKSQGRMDAELNEAVRRYRVPLSDPGPFARILERGSAARVFSPSARREIHNTFLDEISCQAFAVVPLSGKERVIGVLFVDNLSTRDPITREEISDLSMLCDHAGLAIENAVAYSGAVDRSRRDPLTGLWNHARFQEILLQSMQAADLLKTPLSILLFDVDNFKSYNDQLGHQQGDKALKFVAEAAARALRKSDLLARYGGEEFAVILPGANRDEAVEIAEKLRSIIEQRSSSASSAQTVKTITVSIGVASYPNDALDREKLIYCADTALYLAKNDGKNRTCRYLPPRETAKNP
jgi:diguanylate cyclase (GGDEF)-like protein